MFLRNGESGITYKSDEAHADNCEKHLTSLKEWTARTFRSMPGIPPPLCSVVFSKEKPGSPPRRPPLQTGPSMPRIHKLSPTLINQIAAGEVVDRPAGVVKELLENAVDAGSRRIDVEVAQGGIDLIRVADDGCGIPAEDFPLAFASHATSKLAAAEDLFRIGTLGFWGEALASVGSIAQVTLQSRPAGQECGAAISCRGGELGPVTPWNGSQGTRVEVRHLFYNVPARRKFLKGAGTEMGHVAEVVIRLALSQLGIHWTLRHNGRSVYEAPGTMGLLDRIGLFFGAEVCNSLYMLEAEEGLFTLGGYVGDPSCERSNSQLLYLFLNGRWVRDRGLSQAVQDAYRGLLMKGRYPVAFLMLEVPPEEVDINVHPTKAEVRFRDKDAVYEFVHRVVRERLQAADLTARMQLSTKKEFLPATEVNGQTPLLSDKPAPSLRRSEGQAPSLKPVEMPAATQFVKPLTQPRPPAASVVGSTTSTQPPSKLFAPTAQTEKPVSGGRQQGHGAEPLPARKMDVVRAMQVLDGFAQKPRGTGGGFGSSLLSADGFVPVGAAEEWEG